MDKALLEIHEKRAVEDPIYRLFHDIELANQILDLLIEYVCKRYGDRLTCSKMVVRVYDLLLETDDHTIKIFAIFFFLTWELEFREQITELYKTENTSDGIYNAYYFSKLMCRVSQYVDMTLNFPYNKCNIVPTVNNYVAAVKSDYLIGPSKK